jgi:hypothetical protein
LFTISAAWKPPAKKDIRGHGSSLAAMIALYGGQERSSTEWGQMAGLAGLRVTFEAYPPFREDEIEMRMVESSV